VLQKYQRYEAHVRNKQLAPNCQNSYIGTRVLLSQFGLFFPFFFLFFIFYFFYFFYGTDWTYFKDTQFTPLTLFPFSIRKNRNKKDSQFQLAGEYILVNCYDSLRGLIRFIKIDHPGNSNSLLLLVP
jgi:hypothetical protein